MIQIVRFALLLGAILVTPWLATNAPPELVWNSGWVQAIGSIGAIGVGFAYIGLQNRWHIQHRERQEKEMRTFYERLAANALADQNEAIDLFTEALNAGLKVVPKTGRDSQDIIGEELLQANAVACGSGAFTIQMRKAGLNAKGFAYVCATAASTGIITQPAVTEMHRFRGNFTRAVQTMATLI